MSNYPESIGARVLVLMHLYHRWKLNIQCEVPMDQSPDMAKLIELKLVYRDRDGRPCLTLYGGGLAETLEGMGQ
jgi:hypothetical protein